MGREYYIFSSGRLRKKENTIYLETATGEERAIPIEDVETIHVFGEVDLNSKLLNFLSQQGKILHFYNYYGFYSGSFVPRDKSESGNLTVKQAMFYLDQVKRQYLAISFIEGAIHHMKRNLREYDGTDEFINLIQSELYNAYNTRTIPELMGCEGRARNTYYQAFNVVLKNKFTFSKRTKKPPLDPLNALISFGNSLVYSVVLSQIYLTQLNPTISYLHEPSEKRYSLSLDLAEIFKPLIVDPIIFKLVNTNILSEEDFDSDLNYCYLTESGRKKFIREIDAKLNTTIKHRKLKRNVSYKSLIKLECYKLVKHFLEDEVYQPLKAWW